MNNNQQTFQMVVPNERRTFTQVAHKMPLLAAIAHDLYKTQGGELMSSLPAAKQMLRDALQSIDIACATPRFDAA